ncbi:isopropylmalate isomerase [Parerythrobacter aurantius]|uniref:isopropylmalate isomerase n=1 Tax=Parerythrobacter aurantius TaxID=3127706 RepID=UPI003252E1B1
MTKKLPAKTIAGAVGSAAIAAALLYVGKRKKKDEKPKPGTVPSGEKPETD